MEILKSLFTSTSLGLEALPTVSVAEGLTLSSPALETSWTSGLAKILALARCIATGDWRAVLARSSLFTHLCFYGLLSLSHGVSGLHNVINLGSVLFLSLNKTTS